MTVDLLKQALASFGACIIAMLGFWFAQLKDIPTRAETEKIAAATAKQLVDENPYLKERELMLYRLDALTKATNNLDHTVRELNSRIDRMPSQRAATGLPPTPDKPS